MQFHHHRAALAFFVVALGVSSMANETHAATFTWNCTNDNWDNTP